MANHWTSDTVPLHMPLPGDTRPQMPCFWPRWIVPMEPCLGQLLRICSNEHFTYTVTPALNA